MESLKSTNILARCGEFVPPSSTVYVLKNTLENINTQTKVNRINAANAAKLNGTSAEF